MPVDTVITVLEKVISVGILIRNHADKVVENQKKCKVVAAAAQKISEYARGMNEERKNYLEQNCSSWRELVSLMQEMHKFVLKYGGWNGKSFQKKFFLVTLASRIESEAKGLLDKRMECIKDIKNHLKICGIKGDYEIKSNKEETQDTLEKACKQDMLNEINDWAKDQMCCLLIWWDDNSDNNFETINEIHKLNKINGTDAKILWINQHSEFMDVLEAVAVHISRGKYYGHRLRFITNHGQKTVKDVLVNNADITLQELRKR